MSQALDSCANAADLQALATSATLSRNDVRALRRRLITIPTLLVATVTVISLAPVLLVSAMAADLVLAIARRRPFMAVRLVLFACVYLLAETVGLAALLSIWLFAGVGERRAARMVSWTYAVQRRWAGALLFATRAIFSLRFDLEGDDAIKPGPLIVFIRHTSIVDTLLPTAFVTARHGIRLRFVLKRELLTDPCLDVAGLRLPNTFVGRDGSQSEQEIGRVRALAQGLGARDGVLIYPEGTRFSPQKRLRMLDKLAERDPEQHALASALVNVLPPKLGGPLALLDACDADALFFAHTGLEGFAKVGDVFRGAMVGKAVRMRAWRVPRAEIPEDGEGRAAWLLSQWAELDRWVTGARAEAPS